MSDQGFQWTKELTEELIHLKFKNDWLFKTNKRPWLPFHKLMIEKGFPKSSSAKHIRKKWNYTYDEYQKAIATNNRSWIYYDIFQEYREKENALEEYPTWSDQWILSLIESRTKNHSQFTDFHYGDKDPWSLIERDLRKEGLPIECSLRLIPDIWNTLMSKFRRRHRFHEIRKTTSNIWPFYEAMKTFCDTCHYEDGQCDFDGKAGIHDIFGGVKSNKAKNVADDDDFFWTTDLTESFIHIRLQNELLFKSKKWPWKDMHSIMIKEGFPPNMTAKHIRRKWSTIYLEYQKALALNNTQWKYFNIFGSYLGAKTDVTAHDQFSEWPEEHVKNFILYRTKHESDFTEDDSRGWVAVEKELRNSNLPLGCSLMNLDALWNHLLRMFQLKSKFSEKDGNVTNWPYYDAMKTYFDSLGDGVFPDFKDEKPEAPQDDKSHINLLGDDDDLMTDCDDNAAETEYDFNMSTCRICEKSEKQMKHLFGDDTEKVVEKLKACAQVEISVDDNLPQQICLPCHKELEAAYNFKLKCEEADKSLRLKYTNSNRFEIKSEFQFGDDCGDATFDADSDNDDENISIAQIKEMCKKRKIGSMECLKKGRTKNKRVKNMILATNQILRNRGRFSQLKGKKTKKKTDYDSERKFRSRSRNVVIVPFETETGEIRFKKQYVYVKVCELCGKSVKNMVQHMKGHSREKTYACAKCDKRFIYSSGLINHMRTHRETPLQMCQLCGKNFNGNPEYRRHLIYHANERKFSCETCGQGFNSRDILKVHVRRHTGERPYTCQECGKNFRTAGCVTRHKKVHGRGSNPSTLPPCPQYLKSDVNG